MPTEYQVVWEIDIEADSPVEAAREALRIQRDPSSHATVFDVIEPDGHRHRIDLDITAMPPVTPPPTRILVDFDYADGEGHLSELVEATAAQAALLREILARAEAAEAIRPDWYVGEPQPEPTPFEEFLARLRWAVGPDVVHPHAEQEADPRPTA